MSLGDIDPNQPREIPRIRSHPVPCYASLPEPLIRSRRPKTQCQTDDEPHRTDQDWTDVDPDPREFIDTADDKGKQANHHNLPNHRRQHTSRDP